MASITFTGTTATTWVSPITGTVSAVGNAPGGGGGGDDNAMGTAGGSGGAGGGYASGTFAAVAGHSYNVTIGAAGVGGADGSVNGTDGGDLLLDDGGTPLLQATGGQGGFGSINGPGNATAGIGVVGDLVLSSGGAGGSQGGATRSAGAGGGGGGDTGVGGDGQDGQALPTAAAGGTGNSPGGNGGDGGTTLLVPTAGSNFGGGGGGGRTDGVSVGAGADGAPGQLVLTWTVAVVGPGSLVPGMRRRNRGA